MTRPLVDLAEELADTLLFPAAREVDAADIVPRDQLDRLAEAGLYGLAGPREYGGQGAEQKTAWDVIERLASGCLATTFVWLQHNTPVRELTASPNATLRDAWLPAMCAGRLRAGIALGGLHQGSAGLTARPVEGGWLVSGVAPYVTGWGLLDLLLVAALTDDGRVVRGLLEVSDGPRMVPERLQLLAANASSTVRLRLQDCFLPDEHVLSVQPYKPPPPYDGGGRPNGSLALGVARRCLRLLGPGPLDAALDACRERLDAAGEEEMAEARAAAAELAVRAAAALVTATGSRAIYAGEHAERLYREAAFTLVFGSRAAIKSSLLRRLGA